MSRRYSPLRRAVYFVQALPLFALVGMLRALPLAWASGLGGFLARLVGPLLPPYRVARRNLARCFPDKSEAERRALLRDMLDNLGRNIGEFPQHDRMTDARLDAEIARLRADLEPLRAAAARGQRVDAVGDRFAIEGIEQAHRLMEHPGPVLLFFAHLGNWEILRPVAERMGLDTSVVFRTPNNPYAARLIERGRHARGVKLLPKGLQGAFAAARVMEEGGRLGLLIDQKQNRGIAVPFFGRPAMTGTTLALFALRYRAPIYGAHVIRLPGSRFRIVIEPPLDVAVTGDEAADIAAIMTAANAAVERWVRAHPGQWLWLHRRWIEN